MQYQCITSASVLFSHLQLPRQQVLLLATWFYDVCTVWKKIDLCISEPFGFSILFVKQAQTVALIFSLDLSAVWFY